MPSELFDAYRWLIGSHGRQWLQRIEEEPLPLVRQAARLRKELSAARVHLVLEQAELRRRARTKFSQPQSMFFTPIGLEQATDETVAFYKAARFRSAVPLADLCCGIGGDLTALARRASVMGVDRDPIAALVAEANLDALHPVASGSPQRVHVADAAAVALDRLAGWHIDPDRRPGGRRTTRVELYEPDAATLDHLLRTAPNAAIKLAPAAGPPEQWQRQAELEWVSRGRECRQLVVWFGDLAQRPGHRRATVLADDGPGRLAGTWTIVGLPSESPPVGSRILRYVFEPDPAVIAARLVPALAERNALTAIDRGCLYLTGDRPVSDPGMACFEVDDLLPFDRKRLKQVLESRGVGRLEIKKRGVSESPEHLRRQLRLRGDKAAVLLLAPVRGSIAAILARRVVCRTQVVRRQSDETD